jgi:CDP-diacylglycerol--glycerol-3-phosphate 3-phosphatidyltransferase
MVFVVASATDFFDGFIAREWNQKTKLGAIIDPLADKMITIAAFLGLMVGGEASAWAIYIIIIRELFITGIRTVAVAEGLDIKASMAGKIKTVMQMIAIGFLLMHWTFGEELLWLAVALTVYSGVEYLWSFRKALLKDEI